MLLREYLGSVLHQKFNIENYNSIYEDLMKNREKMVSFTILCG